MGHGAAAVSADGAFTQGVQVGAHTKPDAEFVGATARRRRRELRLAELDKQINEAGGTVEGLDGAIDRIETLLSELATARKELPRTGPIAVAARVQTEAVGMLRARRETRDTARSNLDKAIAEVGDRQRRLARTAAEHRISPEPDVVDQVGAAVERFHRSAHDLVTARDTEASRADTLQHAEQRRDDARTEAAELADDAAEAEREHAEQEHGLATLRASVGDDVDKVLRDIEETKARIQATDRELTQQRKAHGGAAEQAGKADGAVNGAHSALATAIAEAQADAGRLAPYAHREILDLLRVPTGPAWPGAAEDWPDPAELAAEAERTLARSPDAGLSALPDAVTGLHDAIHAATAELSPTEASLKSTTTRLSSALDTLQGQLSAAGHDYHPEWEADQDMIVVRVADEGGYAPIGDFARRITDARRDQEQLLTESERRILEDALLGRLAQQIHDRTIDARDLIGRMSAEMRTRRMSSGVTVGVHWELADTLDDGQREICRLLDRDASRLGPDELAGMRAHFASRIKTARAQHPDKSYADLLADVLDYRRWRTFAFTLVAGDGGEERLTQARHSTLSGGEQSVSLHLPLFAAAHVTLSSARAHCPRLLALDEAFAGVDDTGRRELLGLTAQFDLDLFMTGYDLWAA
ncbi:MAG: SbcC/MukB-like Walker B domain-containing protein, partial [Pseudonocardiaceae bacterium]